MMKLLRSKGLNLNLWIKYVPLQYYGQTKRAKKNFNLIQSQDASKYFILIKKILKCRMSLYRVNAFIVYAFLISKEMKLQLDHDNF